ncbi:MAG TPA: hypothetical protein VLJ42_01525 [Solirubrobacteraceae bacterium]|nr:hypothetical protein [Solirubrobacteraceae bacterium]
MTGEEVSQVWGPADSGVEGWVALELPVLEVAEALRVAVGDGSSLTTLIAAALAPARAQGKLISSPTSLPSVCEATYAPMSDELRISVSPLYSARLIVDSATELVASELVESEAVEILSQRVTAVDAAHADPEDQPNLAMLIAAALAPATEVTEQAILSSIGADAVCRVSYSLARDELSVSLLPLHRLMVAALFERADVELSAEEIGEALSLSARMAGRCMSALVELQVLSEQQKFGLSVEQFGLSVAQL